jgi:membrane-bound lytic murein transglycosylase D
MVSLLQRYGRQSIALAAAWILVGCGTLATDRPDDAALAGRPGAEGAAVTGQARGPDTAALRGVLRGTTPPPAGSEEPPGAAAPDPQAGTAPDGPPALIPGDAAPGRLAPAAPAIWDRIRAGFAMPVLRSPLVEQRVRWYMTRPEDLERMLERGAPYLHFIVEEIARRGLPMELALLPFVESAMNPVALSHASAAGLWQFIPATGRRFDLSQDWWVDQRRDVVASTRAALDYLQEVYAMQGNDWFLALASYNWGEYAVARAVQANRRAGRPAGYENLNMPKETRLYVPKLLALREIVVRAAELGIDLPYVPDLPYFVSIEHPVPMDLKLAARFAGMSLDEFVALNPAHNRPVIASGRHDEIRLPVDRVAAFQAAARRHAQLQRPFVSWHPYTLDGTDTLETLAARTGVSVAELRQANGLPPNRPLRAGSRILVPGAGAVDASYVDSFEGARLLFHPPVRESRAGARAGRRTQAPAVRVPGAGSRTRVVSPGAAPAASGKAPGRPGALKAAGPRDAVHVPRRAPTAQGRPRGTSR